MTFCLDKHNMNDRWDSIIAISVGDGPLQTNERPCKHRHPANIFTVQTYIIEQAIFPKNRNSSKLEYINQDMCTAFWTVHLQNGRLLKGRQLIFPHFLLQLQ